MTEYEWTCYEVLKRQHGATEEQAAQAEAHARVWAPRYEQAMVMVEEAMPACLVCGQSIDWRSAAPSVKDRCASDRNITHYIAKQCCGWEYKREAFRECEGNTVSDHLSIVVVMKRVVWKINTRIEEGE